MFYLKNNEVFEVKLEVERICLVNMLFDLRAMSTNNQLMKENDYNSLNYSHYFNEIRIAGVDENGKTVGKYIMPKRNLNELFYIIDSLCVGDKEKKEISQEEYYDLCRIRDKFEDSINSVYAADKKMAQKQLSVLNRLFNNISVIIVKNYYTSNEKIELIDKDRILDDKFLAEKTKKYTM